MIDAATNQTLNVQARAAGWSTLRLLEDQLSEVCQVLDANGFRYRIDQNIISLNGGPQMTQIHFGQEIDVAAIQKALDGINRSQGN